MVKTNLIWADFLALGLYFVIIIGIGIWVLRISFIKNKFDINYDNLFDFKKLNYPKNKVIAKKSWFR